MIGDDLDDADDDAPAGPDPKPVDRESRARTHLANERTFLAWFRTGFTLVALGVAASQFLGIQPAAPLDLARLLGGATVAGGLALIGGGYVRYRATSNDIEAGRFRPAGRSIDLGVVLAILVGIVALAFVLLASPA